MKLLLVTSRFPYGTKETFLTEEIAALSKTFDVLVAPASPTSEPLAVPWLRNNSMRLRLGSARSLKLAIAEAVSHPVAAFRAFATVVTAPRSIRARIKNAVIFPTALALSRIARREGVDHVHGYWLSTPSTVAYVVSRLNGIPWSASGHRHDLVDFNVSTIGVPRAGFVPAARFVRTISEQGARALQHLSRAGVPVHTIHLGVTLPPLQERSDDRTFHLVCAANLEPVKGHETLLRALQAASRLVHVRATILGDGSLRNILEARARELGLDDVVTFEGVVPHGRLLERIDSGEFDAAILASLDEGPAKREGIPVFLMEAMARGLPVIATSSGAVGELLNDGNGIVCPPGDHHALADAIERLARDGALRRILARSGRHTIESAFEVEGTSRRLAVAIDPGLQEAGQARPVSVDVMEREAARVQL